MSHSTKLIIFACLAIAVFSDTTIPGIVAGGNNDELITAFQTYTDDQQKQVYQDYLTVFQKNWVGAELATHYAQFKTTMGQIYQHNQSNSTYKQGINQFTDLSAEEFRQYLGLRFPARRR